MKKPALYYNIAYYKSHTKGNTSKNYEKYLRIDICFGGQLTSLIGGAEGAKPKGSGEIVYSSGVDEFGHARLGGVGYCIGKEIEKRFENIDTRAVVLGHLQRGGSPIAFDRVLATRFGIAAIDLVHEGRFGEMVAIQGNAMVSVPLKDVVGKRKTVDLNLYEIAATFFG